MTTARRDVRVLIVTAALFLAGVGGLAWVVWSVAAPIARWALTP